MSNFGCCLPRHAALSHKKGVGGTRAEPLQFESFPSTPVHIVHVAQLTQADMPVEERVHGRSG